MVKTGFLRVTFFLAYVLLKQEEAFCDKNIGDSVSPSVRTKISVISLVRSTSVDNAIGSQMGVISLA